MKKNIYKKLLLSLLSSCLLTGCSNEEENSKIYSVTLIEEHDDEEVEEKIVERPEVHEREEYVMHIHNDTYAYAGEKSSIKEDFDKEKIKNVGMYQKVKILKEYTNDYYYVEYTDSGKTVKGYVKSSKLKKLPKKYVEVDLSDQYLKFYSDNKVALETSVVTGLNYDKKRKTPQGYYKVYYKQENATLKGEDYSSDVEVWMPFYLGYGLHDAPWRSTFGGEIYKTNGSHGCVNMPPEKAKKLYNQVDLGTKVLVHK